MASVIQTDGISGTVWPNSPILTVTVGNSLIVAFIQDSDSALASFSVSDDLNGAYGSADNSAHDAGVGKSIAIFKKHNIVAGLTTISIQGLNGTFGQGIVFEVSGLANAAARAIGSQVNASGTSHFSAAAALSATGFVLCGIGEASNVAHTPGTGYTNRDGQFARDWAQYKTGAINDRGDFSTGSAVTSLAIMAIYSAPAFNLVRP